MWKKHSYKMVNIVIDSEGEEEEEEEDQNEEEEGNQNEEERPRKSINYVIGDVTKPVPTAKTPFNIVVHCAGQFNL